MKASFIVLIFHVISYCFTHNCVAQSLLPTENNLIFKSKILKNSGVFSASKEYFALADTIQEKIEFFEYLRFNNVGVLYYDSTISFNSNHTSILLLFNLNNIEKKIVRQNNQFGFWNYFYKKNKLIEINYYDCINNKMINRTVYRYFKNDQYNVILNYCYDELISKSTFKYFSKNDSIIETIENYRDNENITYVYKFDENKNLIFFKTGGYQVRFYYNSNGLLSIKEITYSDNKCNRIMCYEYDENGLIRIIYEKDFKNNIIEKCVVKYEF